MMDEPFISVIIPTKNAEQSIERCLRSLKSQDYPEDKVEIIVSDGLSTDATVSIAKQYGAKVIMNPKQTVAPGRNLGFTKAQGELIAFTDTDCVVDRNWLRNCVKYFRDSLVAGVGGPNFTPQEESAFGKAVGFVFAQRMFSAGSIHARNLMEIIEIKSLPGCNAIYRKRVLNKIIPTDETLLTCDDTEMNQRVIDLGYKLLNTPDVFVWHHRRSTPCKLWRQFYRYAIGRLQLGKRIPKTINLMHIGVGLFIPLIFFILITLYLLRTTYFLIFLEVIALSFLFIIGFAWIKSKSFKVALNIPLVISIIALAWSSGFLRESIMPLRKVEGR